MDGKTRLFRRRQINKRQCCSHILGRSFARIYGVAFSNVEQLEKERLDAVPYPSLIIVVGTCLTILVVVFNGEIYRCGYRDYDDQPQQTGGHSTATPLKSAVFSLDQNASALLPWARD